MSKLQSYLKESEHKLTPTVNQLKLGVMENEMAVRSIESTCNDISSLIEIECGLGDIATSVETVLKNSQLTEQSAEFIRHAVQGYVSRIGLNSNDVVPSLESFTESVSSESKVVASLEGIAKVLISVWEAIKKAVLKVYNAVKSFFSGFFGNKLDKSTAKIEDTNDNIDIAIREGYVLKDKSKIPFLSIRKLQFEGKIDHGSIMKGLANVEAFYKEDVHSIGSLFIDFIKEYDELIDGLYKKDKEVVKRFKQSLDKLNVEVSKIIKNANKKQLPAKTVVVEKKAKPIVVTLPDITIAKKGKGYKGKAEVEPFTLSQLKELNDSAKRINDLLAYMEKDTYDLSDSYEALIVKIDKLHKYARDDAELVNLLNDNATNRLFNFVRTPITVFIARSVSFGDKLTIAVNELIEETLKAYGEETESK